MTKTHYRWEKIKIMETSIDDMNPELYPYLVDKLLALGALDAYLQQIIMKKGRPGVLITVLAHPEHEQILLHTIFTETTTLGIRVREEKRAVLHRGSITVDTAYGPVRVKVALPPGQAKRYQPEFKDCQKLAQATDTPLAQIFQAATLAAIEQHS